MRLEAFDLRTLAFSLFFHPGGVTLSQRLLSTSSLPKLSSIQLVELSTLESSVLDGVEGESMLDFIMSARSSNFGGDIKLVRRMSASAFFNGVGVFELITRLDFGVVSRFVVGVFKSVAVRRTSPDDVDVFGV